MMTIKQLEHSEFRSNTKHHTVYVVCENIKSPDNIGMIFRVSEAMGVKKIYLAGETVHPLNKRINKVSRSTVNFVSYTVEPKVENVILKLKREGFTIIALEITNKSKALSVINFRVFKKIAVVVGSEKYGLSPFMLREADVWAHIPLYGKNSSINVATALSIGLYELTQQINKN